MTRVGFKVFCDDVVVSGDLDAVLDRLDCDGFDSALFAHKEPDGAVWYRPRVFRETRVPTFIEDFVGTRLDPSKARGLAKTALVTNLAWTSGGEELEFNADRVLASDLWGELRLHAHVEKGRQYEIRGELESAFVEYAQASIVTPRPEPFLRLGRLAYFRGDYNACIRFIETGWKIAARTTDFWPWSRLDRDFAPALCVSRAYLARGDHRNACSAAERGLVVRPCDAHLTGIFWTAARALARRKKIQVGFCGYEEGTFPDVDGTVVDSVVSADSIRSIAEKHVVLVPSEFEARRLKSIFPFFDDKFRVVRPVLKESIYSGESDVSVHRFGGNDRLLDEILAAVRKELPDLTVAEGSRAKVWLYPALQEDASCMAALHAQAGGCVPVASATGCLPEFVLQGYLIRSPVGSVEWKVTAVQRIIKLLREHNCRSELAECARVEVAKKFGESTALEDALF